MNYRLVLPSAILNPVEPQIWVVKSESGSEKSRLRTRYTGPWIRERQLCDGSITSTWPTSLIFKIDLRSWTTTYWSDRLSIFDTRLSPSREEPVNKYAWWTPSWSPAVTQMERAVARNIVVSNCLSGKFLELETQWRGIGQFFVRRRWDTLWNCFSKENFFNHWIVYNLLNPFERKLFYLFWYDNDKRKEDIDTFDWYNVSRVNLYE